MTFNSEPQWLEHLVPSSSENMHALKEVGALCDQNVEHPHANLMISTLCPVEWDKFTRFSAPRKDRVKFRFVPNQERFCSTS